MINAIKGKAKESRSASGTAVDDVNAAQMELRSLDLGQYVSVSPVTLLPTFKFFLVYYIGEEYCQFSRATSAVAASLRAELLPIELQVRSLLRICSNLGDYMRMWQVLFDPDDDADDGINTGT